MESQSGVEVMARESERVAVEGAGAMGVMTAYPLRQANLAVFFS
jgi:glycine/D-amino acid oxidase-like deaminating enzyme